MQQLNFQCISFAVPTCCTAYFAGWLAPVSMTITKQTRAVWIRTDMAWSPCTIDPVVQFARTRGVVKVSWLATLNKEFSWTMGWMSPPVLRAVHQPRPNMAAKRPSIDTGHVKKLWICTRLVSWWVAVLLLLFACLLLLFCYKDIIFH